MLTPIKKQGDEHIYILLQIGIINWISVSYVDILRFVWMLIGSEIPPQADIIKFVITGGDPRVAVCGAVYQAKILASLGISLTPLNCALNAFTLALKDSADALVERLSK